MGALHVAVADQHNRRSVRLVVDDVGEGVQRRMSRQGKDRARVDLAGVEADLRKEYAEELAEERRERERREREETERNRQRLASLQEAERADERKFARNRQVARRWAWAWLIGAPLFFVALVKIASFVFG